MPCVLHVCSELMREYNEAYRTGYYQIIQSVREQMDQMKNFDFREQYDTLVGEITENIIVSRLNYSVKSSHKFSKNLLRYTERMKQRNPHFSASKRLILVPKSDSLSHDSLCWRSHSNLRFSSYDLRERVNERVTLILKDYPSLNS